MEQAQNNQNRIKIAIDGYAGCGKSTLARHLAQALEYTFIDTGAMYRSVAYLAINQFGNVKDSSLESIVKSNPLIQFEPITNSILVNGVVLENEKEVKSDSF
jgi:cytidylate kinase